jgi:hypothetical protein
MWAPFRLDGEAFAAKGRHELATQGRKRRRRKRDLAPHELVSSVADPPAAHELEHRHGEHRGLLDPPTGYLGFLPVQGAC